ncbi:unnamed protein product [Amoebophrya sp. A25]|nr:unnamed protein product [Amoebophrya sp. A25]|eukprot:GSA25T00005298001.1
MAWCCSSWAWVAVLGGFLVLVGASLPFIQHMAKDRLANIRNSDGSVLRVEEQKIWALRRIAFVVLLVTGTQWLGAALRTPIFQEYVSVESERVAREYSVWSIIPLILFYNVLTSISRPQTLVYRISYAYGAALLVLALYIARLDANGGKNGVRAFDDPDGGQYHGCLWSVTFRHFMLYLFFLVVETRSVILNGMVMSFLQLYMGATNKTFSVAVFAFMNFWQQIGIMTFLFGGSISRYMSIDVGDGAAISGSVVLTIGIAVFTFLIAELSVPAYDALEMLKLREEAENPDLPPEARAGGLQSQAKTATYSYGAAGSQTSTLIPGSARGTVSNMPGLNRDMNAADAEPAAALQPFGAGRTIAGSSSARMSYSARARGASFEREQQTNSLYGGLVQNHSQGAYGPLPTDGMEANKDDAVNTGELGAAGDRLEQDGGGVDGNNFGNRLNHHDSSSETKRDEPVSAMDRVSSQLSSLHAYIVKMGLSSGASLDKETLAGGDVHKTTLTTKSKFWSALKQQGYSSVEGLLLLLSHSYVFLLFIVSYSNLPIRQMIDIQLAVILAHIYPCPPDGGDSLSGPSCSHMKDEKLTLMTACGLFAGALNAVVNVVCTQQLVKKLGVKFTLVLNPLLALLTLFVFVFSEGCSMHHSWVQVNDSAHFSYTESFVPWNDRASAKDGAVNRLTEISKRGGVVEFAPGGVNSYNGRVVAYEWAKHLEPQQVFAPVGPPPKGPQQVGQKEAGAAGDQKDGKDFLPLVDAEGRANYEILTHLQQDATNLNGCAQLCSKHYHDCEYLTFNTASGKCTMFGKTRLSDRAKAVHQPLDQAVWAGTGQGYYTIGSPRTFEQVAAEVQRGGGGALVIVMNRSVNQVKESQKPDGTPTAEAESLTILTAIIPTRSWSDELAHGKNLESMERMRGNTWGLSAFQRYIFIAIFWMLWSAVHFSVCNPTIALLTLRTTAKVKVKAKSWSNSFGNNLMKMLGNRGNNIFNVPLFMAVPSLIGGCSWILFWLVCAMVLGSMYQGLEERDEYVGADPVYMDPEESVSEAGDPADGRRGDNASGTLMRRSTN